MVSSLFPLELPRSKATIEFKSPTFGDRTSILKEYDRSWGYTAEDALAISCVQKINGQSVKDNSGTLDFFGQCPNYDYMYYIEVFFNMFMLDEDARKDAASVAKKILNGESITSTQKKSPATQHTGKVIE